MTEPHRPATRRATPDDLPALHEITTLLKEDSPFARRGLRALEEGNLYMTSADGKPAALGWIEHSFFDQGFVALVIARREFRRAGHAAALMQAMEEACRTPKLFVSTNLTNHPMQQLLRKRGYVYCGTIDQLDPGDPEVFFVKNLHAAAGEK